MIHHAAALELTELAKDLDRAARAAPATVDRVLAVSAQMILIEMKAMTPVDTGRLRASETVVASKGRYVVGPVAVPYAAYVEFGTRHMRAQPYVRPAVQKYLDELGPKAADVGVSMILGRGYDQHS